MSIAIDPGLLVDPSDPSIDVLNYAISQLGESVKRLKLLDDYYKGDQAILHRVLDNNKHSSNQKVMVNHAKYIVDMASGFTVGNPVAYTAKDGANIDDVVADFKVADAKTKDMELAENLSTFGTAFELDYLKTLDDSDQPQTQTMIAVLDPRSAVLVTDDSTEHNPLFGIYIQQKLNLLGLDNGYLITVYSKTKTITYRTFLGKVLSTGNVKSKVIQAHYFGDVPLIEYQNNKTSQGDFEQEISSIDAYNTLQSDRITDKQDFIDALMVVYGFSLNDQDGDGVNIKNGMINGAPGKGQDGASVEWLTKQLDEAQSQVLSENIEADIHKTSYIPNMNDSNFMGNVSGEAMKYKLFAMINLLTIKTSYMAQGLRRRLKLFQNILNIKGQNDNVDGTEIVFTPNLPANLSDVITNIKNADGIIPKKISYGWLPNVDNPEDVIKAMDQEKADNIKQNQAALSGQGEQEQDQANIDRPPYTEGKNDSNNGSQK